MAAARFYEFGPFRIDAVKRTLLRDGEIVPLAPKAFDTLLVLAQHPGKVLDKAELMRMLWPDSEVEEANLPLNISALRKALGESPNERRYIITIPGRGYRFAADVEQFDGEGQDLVIEKHTKSILVIEEREREGAPVAALATAPSAALHGRKLLFVSLGALGLVTAIVAGWLLLRPNKPARTIQQARLPGAEARVLAVLPFKQLDVSAGEEYLGMGITDTLITKLSSLKQIVVRPTSSVIRYAGQDKEAVEIGRELGVNSVLEGSIRKSGERLRVTVRLLRVEDGSPLWAEKFDERFTDIFAVEDSISARVAESLVMNLAGEENAVLAKRYTDNTEAYQLYLKGRYLYNKPTPETIKKATAYFQQAIEKDASYALAYAGLAHCYLAVPATDAAPKEAFPKAKMAAARALEIDNRLAEAYAAMGFINFWFDWDWKQAETNLKLAVEMNPNSAEAHFLYAHLFSNLGRHEEAMAEAKRALELDSLSQLLNSVTAQFFYHMRQYDQAIEQAHKVVEIDPNFWIAHALIGKAYTEKGMYSEALIELQKALQHSGGTTEAYSQIGYTYAVSGNRKQAEQVIEVLKKRSKQGYVPLNNIARIYVGLGKKELALDLLEQAVDERETGLTYLKVVPQWDSLRAEPRFTNLLQRVGL